MEGPGQLDVPEPYGMQKARMRRGRLEGGRCEIYFTDSINWMSCFNIVLTISPSGTPF